MLNPLKTSSYDFTLPKELIATHPAQPRESARLLVYNRTTDTIIHTYFYEIEKYLPDNVALIFNNTKVIKARLFGHKESGGKIELLINRMLDAHTINVYIRGKIKVRTELFFDNDLHATVTALHDDGSRNVQFSQAGNNIRFEELLPIIDEIGHIPLPPYIQREDGSEDSIDYQTVFAKHEGAVAAPTASLHFSDTLFDRICKNHTHAFVTLHVGAGTFKPVESETITDHPMHSEYYSITPEAIEIIKGDQPLLCVGTTSTRTVEFYVRTDDPSGEANLFLHPGNPPIRVDHLLTNFHLPQSTLLMLVASFVGVETTHRLYEEAIKENYRFYSYGDAMLIL
ncbi:MAG: tRNA preQ1(34) S-adenosylmethionine ribosyltransferase-isomerase QueA [Epsilonproteobacteria bacterium]|nr:MAG: tRNA preQ1(34) S-adenosylmethionine ribosyltransferase-isomerase QueA [Campylobacterota bacterium]